jgi:hypothetical protein
LRVGDVTNREVSRRAFTHVLCDQAEHRVAHFGHVAQSLQFEMIVRRVEAEEVGRQN